MATITKTQKDIAFRIKIAAKKAKKAKKADQNTKPFSRDEIIEQYFREKAIPKKVCCFDKKFY